MVLPMRPLFSRLRFQSAAAEDLQDLLRELDGLEDGVRDGVARGLAMMWDDLLERFGGISHFLETAEAESAAYLDQLGKIARGMEASVAQKPYAIAAKAMIAYLGAFREDRPSSAAAELSTRVAGLIGLGRDARRRGK